MAPQGQKRAKHDEGDEGTEAELENGGAAAFSKAVVQNLVCSIMHQLFVDPYIYIIHHDGLTCEIPFDACSLVEYYPPPFTKSFTS